MIYTLRDPSGTLDPRDFERREDALVAAYGPLWRNVPWQVWATSTLGLVAPRIVYRSDARG